MENDKEPSAAGPSNTDLSEDSEDDLIIPKKVSNLKGYHPKSGILEDIESPRKRIKYCPFSIKPKLCSDEYIANLKAKWSGEHNFKSKDVEVILDPFRVCVINDFIENKDYVNDLRIAFDDVDWNRRKMDLYEFFQSEDLKDTEETCLQEFYDFLKYSVMTWVSEITGYTFTEVSATCSCYTDTDYLLVHDDQREDRMVAFVYYISNSEEWDSSKGGSLDLLSKDEKGLPLKVVKSILPKNNQFVFFPVTNDSYHQVAEVTSLDDARLSINGWFHVRKPPVFQTPQFEYPASSLYGTSQLTPIEIDLLLESWIDADYLSKEYCTLEEIQKQIEESSEISLKQFFRKEALDEVEQCLELVDENAEKWKIEVPPNRSLYEVLQTEGELPHSLKRFLDLFRSEQFFDYLRIITDVQYNHMKFELQRWTPGSYCLLSDYNWSKEELDVIFYIPCSDDNDIIGGRIQYVNMEEEEDQEALITIEPSKNTLNVVYRDTARFTNYFSKQSRCKKFYLLICTYSE